MVGVVVWQKGNSKRDNIEAAKAPYDPSDGNWQTLQRSGVGLMVGGGIAVAAGAVLYVVGHRERTQGTSSLSFNIGSGQGLVRWEGRF